MGRLLCFVAAVAATIGCAGAFAAGLDKEQHKFTAADQAAAKSAVIQKADLNTAGWTGGAKAPDLSPAPTCPNYHPKQSDLVLTGAAETDWKNVGLEIDTEAQVLKSEGMVALDWQRTVADSAAIACTQTHVKQNLSSGSVKFISFKRVVFAKIGKYSRAYLTTIDVTSNGTTVPITVEDVLIANKRTEFTITSTTAKAEQATVAAADVRLAKMLVARAKA
jgi:hypothetical protein